LSLGHGTTGLNLHGSRSSAEESTATTRQGQRTVNTTPVGMEGNLGMPMPAEFLHPPCESQSCLLRAARVAGCRTTAGGRLQALGAFRLFAGIEPDADRVLRHIATSASRPIRAMPLESRHVVSVGEHASAFRFAICWRSTRHRHICIRHAQPAGFPVVALYVIRAPRAGPPFLPALRRDGTI
jgi:hypothetical protein